MNSQFINKSEVYMYVGADADIGMFPDRNDDSDICPVSIEIHGCYSFTPPISIPLMKYFCR